MPVKEADIDDLISPNGVKVNAVWSAAGIASCVHVIGINKRQTLLFDCGILDSSYFDARHIFITHSHIDHIGQCIALARIKALNKWQGKYYVPYEAVEALEEARVAMSKLDNCDIPMDVVPVKPGDEIIVDINASNRIVSMKVVVFPTVHRIPSQGYAVYLTHRGDLKEEYKAMDEEGIRLSKLHGNNIYQPGFDTIEMVYTGDTVMSGLLDPRNDFVFKAPILITELTYLEGDRSKAAEFGHMHTDDIVENIDKFQNQFILFVHLSQKYRAQGIAVKILRQSLPQEILSKVYVALKCFGSRFDVTKVEAVQYDKREREVGHGWGTAVKRNNLNNETEKKIRKGKKNTISAAENDK